MTIQAVQAKELQKVHVQKSITDAIPLLVELTSVATVTFFGGVYYLGWSLGSTFAVGAVNLVKTCLYDVPVQAQLQHNTAVDKKLATTELNATYKAGKRAASVVVGGVACALCLYTASVATTIFNSIWGCDNVSNTSTLEPLFFARVAVIAISSAGAVISAGYTINKMWT